MAEPTQTTQQLLDEYLAVWNQRDYSSTSDVVSESFVRESPAVRDSAEGPAGLEEQIRRLDEAFSDFEVTLDEQLVGDEIAMAEGTFTGTHDGEFNGIPPTEREVAVRFMDTIRIGDDGITEHRTYYDQREMAEQLGQTED